MTYQPKNGDALVVISPSGKIQAFLPKEDVGPNEKVSTNSPTWKAMQIMAFVRSKSLRLEADKLVKEMLQDENDDEEDDSRDSDDLEDVDDLEDFDDLDNLII